MHVHVLRACAALLPIGLLVAACDSGERPVPYSDVELAPAAVVPVQSNVNTENPILTVANNFEVVEGVAPTLVWSEEFDGAALDPKTWFFETGDGSQYGIPGWGNNELQYYLPDNARLQDGMLKIVAREESIGRFDYTSARINTRDRFAFRYGRIEARMRLPGGQGLWPAFWLLGQDSPYGTWPASGEIDIMEATNLGVFNKNSVIGTIHYGTRFPDDWVFDSVSTVVPANAREEFHTYAVEWDADEIRWYVDDVLYAMQNSWYSTSPFPAPFDQPFYIILNVAVGGNLPGSPNEDTVFPVTMEVDWVRVYSGAPQ
jgi:beta-glucanase (GH16 family)